ncbi:glycosyl hydrolase family 28-related protein [Mediterraneibacter gnavus]|uniref:glycosyl hydrolase family 28-related protein n=1 Tax=Mediterraneibacter gnavus TaxID=33038 RepID=UPI00321BDBBE
MDYRITDYGAVADGTTNNRAAIQAAVDACTVAGGGRVIVPIGQFLSGTIVLKSNVTLYLERGGGQS